jgi:hypothetical protein
VTMKRKIGYHEENYEDEDNMPDATRMKID